MVVASATRKDVPVEISAVGNVEASTTIAVRSQVTGVLQQVGFHEGDFVKKDSVLFTIDPRPLQAALEQSQANLVRDQSLVNQAEAQLARDGSTAEYQNVSAQRQMQLVERGLLAKDAGDQAQSQADATALAVKADRAAVESARAQLKVQQAAVDAAKVQLGYSVVRSPIDGRTGDLTVKPGNLVAASTTQLMTVVQVEPIFVTFSVPAVHLATIKRAAAAGRGLKVIAVPQDGDPQSVEGRLTFWDNVVDPATDTIKLKATMTNNDHRLWPGQFARVTLELDTLPNATVIPQEAMQIGQDGAFVFVVTDKSTVEQRAITAGQRVGDDVVVQKGIEPGERVVTEGQLRLEQGTRVQIGDANGTPAGGRDGRSGRGGRGGRGGRRGGDAAGGSNAQ
ncbi:MAG TPA: efflux RND transporter periplasmic adaptor subunit [Vicinamibacterales bacterium]|nr:efflux RND transporter periplasmic adaptor subunit [Vicinamibacterales bacterium]